MITTREKFEALLPAFRTPTGDIFNRMAPAIEQLETELIHLPDKSYDHSSYNLTDELKQLVSEAACTRAAYNLIPQLDLVITPTGFGIVSNQNTAPASRERVAALREEMRHVASDKYYEFLEALFILFRQRGINFEFRRQMASNLFWKPAIANQYGLRLNGQPIYKEELEALQPKIIEAERQVEEMISLYGMNSLRDMQTSVALNTEDIDSVTYCRILHYVRNFLSLLIMGDNPQNIVAQKHVLMTNLNDIGWEYILDDMEDCSVMEAYKIKYENKKDDPSFFFG